MQQLGWLLVLSIGTLTSSRETIAAQAHCPSVSIGQISTNGSFVSVQDLAGTAVGDQHAVQVGWIACLGFNLPLPTPGDLNGDGMVNVTDLFIVLAAWGDCPQNGPCQADLAPAPHGDGVINVNDLFYLLANWG